MGQRNLGAADLDASRVGRCGWWPCDPSVAALQCSGRCGFPSDSGIVNVRDFGAKGDGRTDDTAALQAAIDAAGPDTGAFFWRTRIVYPASRHLPRLSATLQRRYADGAGSAPA